MIEISPFFQWKITDFEVGKKLGRGKFGRVYVAKEKRSGAIIALKVLYKKEIKVSYFLQEIQNPTSNS